MIKLYFDGGCWPHNPGGFARIGVHIEQDRKVLYRTHGTMAETETSNNVAEYGALITGLEWLIDNGYQTQEIKAIGDSKLVIAQMFRDWNIKSGMYAKYALYCKELVAGFPNIRGKLIPRAQNTKADDLTRIHSTDTIAIHHNETEW